MIRFISQGYLNAYVVYRKMTTEHTPRCWLVSQVHQSPMKLKCKWRAKWNRFSAQYFNDSIQKKSLPHVLLRKCYSRFNDIFLQSWFCSLLSQSSPVALMVLLKMNSIGKYVEYVAIVMMHIANVTWQSFWF